MVKNCIKYIVCIWLVFWKRRVIYLSARNGKLQNNSPSTQYTILYVISPATFFGYSNSHHRAAQLLIQQSGTCLSLNFVHFILHYYAQRSLHIFPLMHIYADVHKTSNHNFNIKNQGTHLHNTTLKTRTPAATIYSTTNLLTIR